MLEKEDMLAEPEVEMITIPKSEYEDLKKQLEKAQNSLKAL